MSAFDEYLRVGGFPELLNEKDRASYITALVDSIIRRDICARHKIRNPRALQELANHILNIAPAKAAVSDFSRIFKIASDHTTRSYVSYLEQAYLLCEVKKYSATYPIATQVLRENVARCTCLLRRGTPSRLTSSAPPPPGSSVSR